MIGIFGMIGEALGLTKVIVDPNNHEKSYKLRKWKQTDKAIDTAEEMFFALDKFYSGALNKDKLKYEYNRNRKIFFENNN